MKREGRVSERGWKREGRGRGVEEQRQSKEDCMYQSITTKATKINDHEYYQLHHHHFICSSETSLTFNYVS